MKLKPILLACALAWPVAAHADPISAVVFLAPIIGGTAAAFVVSYASYIFYAAVAGYGFNRQRAAKQKARDSYNASLRDRLQMVDLLPDAPRTIVLGRARTVEGIRRRWSSGTNSEKLTLIVSFAGHEIDGYTAFYFNDTQLTLDGSGYVQEAPWVKTTSDSRSQLVLLDGSGAAVVVLPSTPIVGSVSAVVADTTGEEFSITVSMAGSTATISGGFPSVNCRVNWQTSTGTSYARIRSYLGTATQNVGADIAAEHTGQITATDKFRGIACAVVDLEYDPDVFPQGLPNITAQIRGAKVYDPRLDSTNGGSGSHRLADATTWAWSQNPALHAYHYARLPNGWGVPAAEIRTADIVAAADACDVSTSFTLRKADDTTSVVTIPRFRSGIVIPTDADPQAMMGEILESMAGRSGWAGGTWRLRAGTMASSVWAMDASWIAQRLAADGTPDGGSVVRISNGVQRDSKVNRVSGSCVDRDQRYQVLPFPGIEDAVLIAAEGEYAVEVEYQAVNHVAHAQHLASIAIRESQAALRMETTCNLSAYRCELFDVGTVTLPRYGMTAKTFEVVGWRWHPMEGVKLSLAEITADIFTVEAELVGRDPAPDSSLPPPWDVERITGVSASSAVSVLSDGTVQTRTTVEWNAATSQAIRAGGQVEVQWTLARDTLPSGDWPSRIEQGGNTETQLDGLLSGRWYVFRARAINSLRVRGDWSLHATAVIVGKNTDPENVAGFAGSVNKGRIVWTWTPSVELDYGKTELRMGGTGWSTATFEWSGKASKYPQTISAAGSYTMRARHFDKSGNDSSTTSSATVTVTDADLVQDGSDAPLLTLMVTAQTFTHDADNLPSPTSQTISLTAQLANLTGTATFTATKYNSAGVSLGAATLGGSGNTRTLDVADFGAAAYCVAEASRSGYSDQVTIVRLRDGSNAYTALLTNQGATVAAANDGTVPSFAGAGGEMKIWKGDDELISGVTYSIVSPTAVTMSIDSGTGVYAVTALSADNGEATVRAVVSGGPTFNRAYTISKSKGGADAEALILKATAQTMSFDTEDAPTPDPQTITFTAALTGITGTATFTCTRYNAAGGVISTPTLGGTGNVRTLTDSQFGAAAYAVIEATRSGYTDQVTVARVSSGPPVIRALNFGASASKLEFATGVAADAYVRISRDGTVEKRQGAGGSWTASGSWYQGGTNPGDDHRVFASATGDALNSGTLDAWQALTSTRTWRLQSPVGAYSEKIARITFIIAPNASDTPACTGYGNLFTVYEP